MKLTVSEILEATRGALISGTPQRVISGVTIDSRKAASGDLFIALQGTQCDGHDFVADALARGATAALVQRGRSEAARIQSAAPEATVVEVDSPFESLGDIARCWRNRFSTHVVAITGSNGKTTTKEMAWRILCRRHACIRNPGNFNNRIGLPLSLFQLDGSQSIAILEMGMSEPGEIKRLAEISSPGTGLITNVGPAHLEHLKSIEAVAAAKAELMEHLQSGDTAIINHDDEHLWSRRHLTSARVLSFGFSGGDVQALNIRGHNCSGSAFDLCLPAGRVSVRLSLPGNHFISNALAAASIAFSQGIPAEDIKTGLEDFAGVPGRMEALTLGGVRVINDAYNANPASVRAALDALSSMVSSRRKIAVLGDMLELGERAPEFHRAIGETAAGLQIDCLFLIGGLAGHIRRGALGAGMSSSNIFMYDSLSVLAEALKEKMTDGDTVLLKGSRKAGLDQVVEILQKQNG